MRGVIRTYLDAGVLISAVRGPAQPRRSAYDLLEDPEREFVASAYLRLEILPKAVYQRNAAEITVNRSYFERVVAWAEPVDEIVIRAEQEAARYGLNALDALHVAAAVVLGADELVTTEAPRKPIYRVESVRVVGL
jgi:predicted nucleic acid-binding protein